MGTCTSTVKRRQRHKRRELKTAIVYDNKHVSSASYTVLPNQRSQSLLTHWTFQSSSLIEPIVPGTENTSLIQLCSPRTMSNLPPRIPVPKSRLPIHQTSSRSIRPNHIPPVIGTTNPTGINPSMSIRNRAPVPPPTSQNPAPTRLGFIPRPTASGLHPIQKSSVAERSRSISPASNNSGKSSNSSVSQRLVKTPTVSKPAVTPPKNVSKPKLPPSKEPTKSATIRTRASTTPQTSTPPTKTDVNAIRDRYKTQKRMNFFTRRTPLPNSLKSPSIETPAIQEEKNEQTADVSIDNSQNEDLKTDSSLPVSTSQGDSAYVSVTYPPKSSQTIRPRQRVSSTISSSSLLSDVLNQDVSLDDENCSLKSDDLICDYEDTLTFESVSKNDHSDSCSSNSLSMEITKKPKMLAAVPVTTKPNIPPFQPVLKDHRPKCSIMEKVNNNLRESLDELGRLSTQMDSTGDNELNRRSLSRSVSLKPPPTFLPPRDDAEQITMDIESYRQVMKDVMVVKTILHQLDRLLKHSDGANMTDSMIGSFHESMINSRHYSSSGVDGNARNSLDETSSYEDLFKEILILRKEKEQDRQTIKLLQEQMYKYSSQTTD